MECKFIFIYWFILTGTVYSVNCIPNCAGDDVKEVINMAIVCHTLLDEVTNYGLTRGERAPLHSPGVVSDVS